MAMMIHEVLKLLGVSNIQGNPKQLAQLCAWIEDLVNTDGEEWVIKNRQTLLKQWDYIVSQQSAQH